MPLEISNFISDLVASNPTGSDNKSTADDHLRLIKSTLKATFPNLSAPVTKTAAQINADYGPGNVLGAVSQAAGVPTGAVIHSGSNASGYFVKFADGTQICTMTAAFAAQVISTGQAVVLPFPAAFASTAFRVSVQATGNTSGGGSQDCVGALTSNGIYKDNSTTASALGLSSYAYRYPVTDGVAADVIVIGRWF